MLRKWSTNSICITSNDQKIHLRIHKERVTISEIFFVQYFHVYLFELDYIQHFLKHHPALMDKTRG